MRKKKRLFFCTPKKQPNVVNLFQHLVLSITSVFFVEIHHDCTPRSRDIQALAEQSLFSTLRSFMIDKPAIACASLIESNTQLIGGHHIFFFLDLFTRVEWDNEVDDMSVISDGTL